MDVLHTEVFLNRHFINDRNKTFLPYRIITIKGKLR